MSAVQDANLCPRSIWSTARLADVAQIVNGGTPSSKIAKYWSGDIQWLTPKDMGQMRTREISQTPRTISSSGLQHSSARLVPAKSVILSTRAPIGHLAINKVPMAFNQGCRALVPSPDLDHIFLYYFFAASRDLLNDLGTGTTFKELSATSLKNLEILLPPLEEQKRIVAILDQAFAALDRARAHTEANLADAQALFATNLSDRFQTLEGDGESIPLDELCVTVAPRHKVKRQDYLPDGAFPVVSQDASLVSGYCNDEETLLDIEPPVVVFGDHTRCLKYIDFRFSAGADGTKILQPRPGIDAGYLYFGLRSKPVPTVGYARHFRFIRERSLPNISLADQRKLASDLFALEDHCEDLQARYQAQLTDLATLRQSILQKAFAGELT